MESQAPPPKENEWEYECFDHFEGVVLQARVKSLLVRNTWATRQLMYQCSRRIGARKETKP
jgi:hypothetical protein